MLILDEATSSIDTRTEIQIQKAFDKMMQGRTSFVVAHRLSTIREADRDSGNATTGRIIEQGSHAELLLKKAGFTRSCITASLPNRGVVLSFPLDVEKDLKPKMLQVFCTVLSL